MRAIAFLGDSLTEYFDWQRRFPEYEVINLGLAGETVQGLRFRVGHIRFDPVPDRIFIMSGANNIAMEDYDITPDFGRIVRELKQRVPTAHLIIQSMLPLALPWINNEMIVRINRELASLSAKLGVDFLDIHRSFVDADSMPLPGLLLDDGVHLSDSGYEVWSGAVEEYLLIQISR